LRRPEWPSANRETKAMEIVGAARLRQGCGATKRPVTLSSAHWRAEASEDGFQLCHPAVPQLEAAATVKSAFELPNPG
jgi:hypothetical protein